MSTLAVIIIIFLILLILGAIGGGLYYWFGYRSRYTPGPIMPIPPPSTRCVLPKGAWEQSCTGGTISGTTLTAQCKDSAGTPKASTLDLSRCSPGPVTNNAGVLTCTPGSGFCNTTPTCALPTGPYQSTCTGAAINGTMLSATCDGPNNTKVQTSLDLRNCGQGDIINNNGSLRCGAGYGYC
ncbi:cyanovirin-N domain protein [Megavirus courdo11]|uniref:Cyanovirin-N domain protein n=5 Tax=Megavirus TaxID=3044761 RepID=L7Y476_9VIRU|nr:cyanovirin-N domain protein [Megavirus chiliensis]AEX61826.1 cyanovirin-N domain protein [Megavirus courdo7]AFX92719.1 cyanovirin-N domain protein [Megavirus courdo11]AGD92579.1 cyanovirin-N domain protein [Megavirus lba]AUV58583.1 cyanovirin-N domain protein [Bandra megavirus]AVL93956.1 cyanovirin-N domain protein [Megavirus vitis]